MIRTINIFPLDTNDEEPSVDDIPRGVINIEALVDDEEVRQVTNFSFVGTTEDSPRRTVGSPSIPNDYGRPRQEVIQEAFDNAVGVNSLDVLSERLEEAITSPDSITVEDLLLSIDFDRVAFPYDWRNADVLINKPNIIVSRSIGNFGSTIRGYSNGDTPIIMVADLTPDNTDLNTLYSYIYKYNKIIYYWSRQNLHSIEEFRSIDNNTEEWLRYKKIFSNKINDFRSRLDRLYITLKEPWVRDIRYDFVQQFTDRVSPSPPGMLGRTIDLGSVGTSGVFQSATIPAVFEGVLQGATIREARIEGYNNVEDLFSKSLVNSNNKRDAWQEWCDSLHIYASWGVPSELGYSNISDALEDLTLLWRLGDINKNIYPNSLDIWKAIKNSDSNPFGEIDFTGAFLQEDLGLTPGTTFTARAARPAGRSGSRGFTAGERPQTNDEPIPPPADPDVGVPIEEAIPGATGIGPQLLDLGIYDRYVKIWSENKIQNTANDLVSFTFNMRNLRDDASDNEIFKIKNYMIRTISLLATIAKNSHAYKNLPAEILNNSDLQNRRIEQQFPTTLLGNPETGALPNESIRNAPYVKVEGTDVPVAVWDNDNRLGRLALVNDALSEQIGISNIINWGNNLGRQFKLVNDSYEFISPTARIGYESFAHDISNAVKSHYEYLVNNLSDNRAYAYIAHWCLIESSRTNEGSAAQLATALSLATFTKWAGQTAYLERYKAILIKEIKNHVGRTLGTYSSREATDLSLISLLREGPENLVTQIDITDEIGNVDNSEDVILGQSIEEIINYVSELLEPIYNILVDSDIFYSVGDNEGSTLWWNIDAYTLWHLLLQSITSSISYKEMLSLSSIDSVTTDIDFVDTDLSIFPSVVIRNIDLNNVNIIELYAFRNKINLISNISNIIENELYDWSDTNVKFGRTIPAFHYTIVKNIAEKTSDVRTLINRVLSIGDELSVTLNESIEKINELKNNNVNIGDFLVKNIWAINGDAKMVSSATQTLSVAAESLRDSYLYPDYSGGAKEDYRGTIIPPRYLPDMIASLYEAVYGARIENLDSDKILAIGSPFTDEVWSSSPIRTLDITYKSNIKPLSLTTTYMFDDGLWCYPKNPISINDGSVPPGSDYRAAQVYASSYAWLYASNGAIQEHSFEDYLNLFAGRARSEARVRAYNLLLSESLKWYVKLLHGLDFSEDKFCAGRPDLSYSVDSLNEFLGELPEEINLVWDQDGRVAIGDRRYAIPFNKIKKMNLVNTREEFKLWSSARPWDRLYLIPWSPNMWLGPRTDRADYNVETIRNEISSNVTVGELEINWANVEFAGVSKRVV